MLSAKIRLKNEFYLTIKEHFTVIKSFLMQNRQKIFLYFRFRRFAVQN